MSIDTAVAAIERRAPRVSDSARIRDELTRLAATTQSAARSRRRRMLLITIPTISVALVVGGVSTAAAVPALESFLGTHPHVTMSLPWATKNVCVNTAYVGADLQVPHPASAATIAAARKAVAQIDFDHLKNTAAWKAASAKASARAAQFPTEFGSKADTLSFDRYTAYSTLIDQLINAKLKQKGIDNRGLVYMGGTSCHKASR